MTQKTLPTKLFFPFVRMIRAMGGRQLVETVEKALKESGGKLTQEAGLQIVGTLIDLLPNAEDETMEFLALYLNKSREEVEAQPIDESIRAIVELVNAENFRGFLNSASKVSPSDSSTSS